MAGELNDRMAVPMDRLTGVGNEPPPKGDKTGIPCLRRERAAPLHESLSAQSDAPHAEWGKLLTPPLPPLPPPPPSPSFTSETDKERRRRKNNLAFELVSLFPSFFFPSLPAR